MKYRVVVLTKINSNSLKIKNYAKIRFITVNKLKKNLKALKGLRKNKFVSPKLALVILK